MHIALGIPKQLRVISSTSWNTRPEVCHSRGSDTHGFTEGSSLRAFQKRKKAATQYIRTVTHCTRSSVCFCLFCQFYPTCSTFLSPKFSHTLIFLFFFFLTHFLSNRTRTRTNTNPYDTKAIAVGRSGCACGAQKVGVCWGGVGRCGCRVMMM
jgi:hypothetical protein